MSLISPLTLHHEACSVPIVLTLHVAVWTASSRGIPELLTSHQCPAAWSKFVDGSVGEARLIRATLRDGKPAVRAGGRFVGRCGAHRDFEIVVVRYRIRPRANIDLMIVVQ